MIVIPETFSITTQRLLLRRPSLEDIPHIFSATRYPGFNDGMLWEPPEREDELIAPYENGLKAWTSGEGYGFSLETKKDATFIGRISIRKEKEKGVWNIGFWTHPEQQGQGYITEAAAAILAFGFEQLEAVQIIACHALWNRASEKVLLKIGMRFIEYLEKGFLKRDVWVAENKLGISKTDWEHN